MKAAGLLLLGCMPAAAALSCGQVAGWAQHGPARAYEADNLFEYMDGNAEGYLLYGFQNMHGITCEKSGTTLVIDISDFGDADSAFGMFSANRDSRAASVRLGMGGQIVPRRAIFAKGKYYVEIAANPEGDHSPILREWTAALEKGIEGTSDAPAVIGWFAAEKQQSLRLVPESVLGLRLLKRGYAAEYVSGKAFIVPADSAAAAAELMGKLRSHFGATAPASIADEAFSANDQYLGRLCVFRKGGYVGGWANAAEGQDAVALARALAGRIP